MEALTTDQNSCLLIGLTKKYQNKLRTKKIQASTCDLQWDFHFWLNKATKPLFRLEPHENSCFCRPATAADSAHP